MYLQCILFGLNAVMSFEMHWHRSCVEKNPDIMFVFVNRGYDHLDLPFYKFTMF